MKFIKFILTPETLLLIAICATAIGILPKSITPFSFMGIGGTYLLYVVIRAVKTHILPKSSFGAASGAMFFLVFGVCLLFTHDQIIIPIGIAVFITFVSQSIWAVWERKFSN